MTSITILHLGDVHLPERTQGSIDQKDKAVSPRLVDTLQTDRLGIVLRALTAYAESHQKVDGILISGDLTTKGDIDAYQQCVCLLANTLQLNASNWTVDRIHVVPGNHDIARKEVLTDADVFAKFKPLEAAWATNKFALLTTDKCRIIEFDKDGCNFAIISLNSCIGCGEIRSLPESIKTELTKVFNDYYKAKPDEAYTLFSEQLDTPSFLSTDLTQIVEHLGRCKSPNAALLLAHHNLLPQAQPRLQIYTELINGGEARATLTSERHPIVYCHGHIHSDPIESVINRETNSDLTSVSAPKLEDGYNILRFEFSTKKHLLGCIVEKFRFREHTPALQRTAQIRVPFCSAGYDKVSTELVRSILEIVRMDTSILFTDLSEQIRSTDTTVVIDSIEAACLEAEWIGVVAIDNKQNERNMWYLRRLIP